MIRVEREGQITTVILARPEVKNAVDFRTAELLVEAFQDFDQDENARVAVLWGEGGDFCAGADLKAIADGQPNRLEPEGTGPLGPSRMLLSKPVIAAIAGHAVAGGLELALWCDLRVVEEDSVLGVFCRRWGVPLIDGGTLRLPAIVGMGRAMELVLSGRPVLAPEALAMGLVNRVVPRGQARGRAEAWARQLAALPQAALRADRLSLLEGSLSAAPSLPLALQREFLRGLEALPDIRPGASAFLSRPRSDT
jgi:enoyl-CoA hydratase